MKTPSLEIDKQLGPLNRYARMYRRVIANLLDHIQKAGFTLIGVNDGEELHTTTTIKSAMEIIFNLDECHIWVSDKPRKHRHYIFVVLGNEDPEDIICDYSFTDGDPDSFEKTMEQFDAEKFG